MSSAFRIQSTRGWRALDLRELWQYRELAYFLTWRDIKVRYKQTAIGIGWALLQPLAMMGVFSLIFARFPQIAVGGVPYPLFAFSALWPWQVFSRALTESTNSLITDQRLVTRVYFPRLLIPLAATCAALIDFLLAGLILIGLMVVYGVAPVGAIALLPLFVILMLVASLGVGFWLSALNVEYRDVMYMVPFLTQLWFFLTPIAYSSSVVSDRWWFLYGLNPMVGVVEGFRWALFGVTVRGGTMIVVSSLAAVALLISGVIWFRRRERTFVDAIGSGGQ